MERTEEPVGYGDPVRPESQADPDDPPADPMLEPSAGAPAPRKEIGERTIPSPTRLAWLRYLILAALLEGEFWFLRRRFTTDFLIGRDDWWVEWVRSTRFGTAWVLCILAATVVIGGRKLWREFGELAATGNEHRFGWTWLIHPLALGFFYLTSARLLDESTSSLSLALVLLWAVAGLTTLVTLLFVAVPPAALGRLFANTKWILLSGVLVGTTVFKVGDYLNETWPFWEPLAHGTLWLSHFFLGFMVEQRLFDSSEVLLGTPDFQVIVTKYCSGYEGMVLFAAIYGAFLVLWRRRLRFPNAILLMPVGMGVLWVLNSVRIAILVVIGDRWSRDVAIDGFHLNAGWPLICLASFGFVALGSRVRFFAAEPMQVADRGMVNPSAVYLGPLLFLIGGGMILGAFAAIPASLYPFRIVAGVLVLLYFRSEYASLRPSWSWPAIGAGALGFLFWIGLHPLLAESASDDPLAWQASSPEAFRALWWTFKVLAMVLVVPVAEELAFRGYLLRRVYGSDFEAAPLNRVRWGPLLVSAGVFGALHDAWIAGTVVGVLYGLVYYRRGRLSDPVLAHATTNGLLLLFGVITSNWGAVL